MRVVLKVLSLQCLWLVSSILSKSIVGLMRHVDQKTQRWWFSSGINKAKFSTYICLSFISCIYLIWIGFSVRNTVIQDKYRFFPIIDWSGNHQFIKQTVYKHIFRWSSNYDTSQRTHAHFFLSPIHKLAISNLKLIRELKNCFEEKKNMKLKACPKSIARGCKLWPWKERLEEYFEPMSFKFAWYFHKLYIKLLLTLETFYLSSLSQVLL